MKNFGTTSCTTKSIVISGKLYSGKSIMGFSEKAILQNQFGELLAYDWLYSRKPKKPV